METLVKVLGAVMLVVLMALVLALVAGFFTMLLWNWLVPSIFHLRPITYWEGWGLCALGSFLFKSTTTESKGKE